MKFVNLLFRYLVLSLGSLVLGVVIITACGGNMSVTMNPATHALVFTWTPAHLLGNVVSSGRLMGSSSSPFVVNAQTVSSGGGNLMGICNNTIASNLPAGNKGGASLFNLGRWTDGNCDVTQQNGSDVGVSIPAVGQIGNLTVDAIGNGGVASDSGHLQVLILPAGQPQTFTNFKIVNLTCTLGTQSGAGNAPLHCEDKNAADHIAVNAGDQVQAIFLFNGGDDFRAIRVNIQYGVPTL